MKQVLATKVSYAIATLAGLGLVAPAPGTCATAITLGFVVLLSWLPISTFTYAVIIAASLLIAYGSICRSLLLFGCDGDPSAIIIDEVVGTLITFMGIALNVKTLLLGFVLFRLFDILKPLGIKRIEQLGGALGIVADDLVAGLYANAVLHLYVWLIA